jgi:hypothetical protein
LYGRDVPHEKYLKAKLARFKIASETKIELPNKDITMYTLGKMLVKHVGLKIGYVEVVLIQYASLAGLSS